MARDSVELSKVSGDTGEGGWWLSNWGGAPYNLPTICSGVLRSYYQAASGK